MKRGVYVLTVKEKDGNHDNGSLLNCDSVYQNKGYKIFQIYNNFSKFADTVCKVMEGHWQGGFPYV